MRNMKISTAQLAKMCGVSQGTVDRALNNRTGISKKTKDMIIDTHTHLYDEDFREDFDSVVIRAKEAGVYKCIMPGIDSSSYGDMCEVEKRVAFEVSVSKLELLED